MLDHNEIQDGLEKMEAGEDPASRKAVPEIRLIGHSSLVYWWPVWATSLFLGAYSLLFGQSVAVPGSGAEEVIPSSTVGLTFTLILLGVIVFTNVKMRGRDSVLFLLSLAVIGLTLAYFELWDDLVQLIPELSLHMDSGFYLFFGFALLAVWALQFFVFDRLVYYRVRPGQLTEERLIGGGERSFDTSGVLFEQKDDDYFRHRILGLGAGDIVVTTAGAKPRTIRLNNVLRAEKRVNQMQWLINVKPDHIGS